ncbi:ScbR family autoregulator-binding transcription factor [Streptomyces sanglieri]|uniref:ScbR family autoregulator-binding transcription factor n=1 Tax=Streptomyces sanglieri TaxID=193460 RepID=A0ABW2WYY9_9ACTN
MAETSEPGEFDLDIESPWRFQIADEGPPMRQERARRTRQVILNVAAMEFAAKGFREASLQEIAVQAEVTKGAIYHHFSSKENLAAYVVEEHYARWPSLVKDVKAQGLSPLGTLELLLDRVARAFHEEPLVQASARLQIERSNLAVRLPAPFVGWTLLLTDLLRAAESAGQLRPGLKPEAAARALVAAFFGVQHIADTLNEQADMLDRWGEVKDLMLPSIRRQ